MDEDIGLSKYNFKFTNNIRNIKSLNLNRYYVTTPCITI